MAKVIIKSEKITPFGGIYYASRTFYALSLDKVINGTLGVRSSTYNGYQWGEVMSVMSDVFLCGGDSVEDANRSECHLRESKSGKTVDVDFDHVFVKTSCFRSDFEADAFLELHSIVETAKKHNKTPFNAIQALFEV